MPGCRLSYDERALIRAGLLSGLSVRTIAREIDRAPSTVSREVRRNRSLRGYRPRFAHELARQRARRPKAFKLERHPKLAGRIERMLRDDWSPEQIAAWLRKRHPDDPRWWVSQEAIYRALYVQGRGSLKEELTVHLRKGRSRRKPHDDARGRLPNMVMISERPPEAGDRAVPGHWEGDLVLGSGARSQVGMLTERTTRFTILFPLPDDRSAPTVAKALAIEIRKLPQHLKRSLTWDQGKEMARHAEVTIETGVQVYFCDPGSPWQRGTAENTIGLIRQYLPKDADLSRFTRKELNEFARKLNGRPRKTLDWDSPAEAYARLVNVATTA